MNNPYAGEQRSADASPGEPKSQGPRSGYNSEESATGTKGLAAGSKHTTGESRSLLFRLTTFVVSAVAVVGGIITIWEFIPHHHPDIAFTNPVPGTFPTEPCNVIITGRGTAPAGQVIAVSNRELGAGSSVDPNQYFAVANANPNGWSVDQQLGSSTTTAGSPYSVTVWLVDAGWADYLTSVTLGHKPWWSSPGLPPGADQVQSVQVSRSPGKC